jgi:hypothetical protein
MKYEDLNVGDFFKAHPNSAVTYRKDSCLVGGNRITQGYNTRTGLHEFVFGVVYPADAMTEEEISREQQDHQAWGKMWANHG